ncbi:MAG: hypothetical protein NT075_12710, partial [Chloroflexi bacterium]|nr:hypothetical protein [Chloroflexota bacterium]
MPGSRHFTLWFSLLVSALLLITLTGAAPAQINSIAGCEVFPTNNVWNAPIDSLPVDHNSAAYINTIGATEPVHPDFGAGLYEG